MTEHQDDRPGLVGVVVETLPSALYRVELEQGHRILAHATGGAGRNFIRVLVGDKVRVELSPTDVTRGRIMTKVG